jgi:ribosomal protein S12 methylthiotransferase accessory factor
MKAESFIPGKDASLESIIETMQMKLAARGFRLNESSLLNEVDGIWSTPMKDNDCPRLFSNGKGATELAARASACGEFFERLSTHYRAGAGDDRIAAGARSTRRKALPNRVST